MSESEEKKDEHPLQNGTYVVLFFFLLAREEVKVTPKKRGSGGSRSIVFVCWIETSADYSRQAGQSEQ